MSHNYSEKLSSLSHDKRPESLFNNCQAYTHSGAHLSLKALFLEYRWSEPSSMMNLIFSKKEAVGAGGWRCSRISMGRATVWQSASDTQAGEEQHSGSSQSVRPSGV